MTAAWVSLAVAVVIGLTKLLTFLLGDKRKLRQLEGELKELYEAYQKALCRNDTVRASWLHMELERVREELRRLKK